MNAIPGQWLWEGSWREPGSAVSRTGATPQFKACESILNLMLSQGYNDFKSN
ncbi:MAG: hypothetical protein MJA30_16330 [Cytophagales bacterium]|nr:hypothetical protein [Cytophagales bacterium]